MILPNEQIPADYELLSASYIGSDSPSLLARGFLVIKRADASDLRLWKSDPIIDDITFMKKSLNEQLPEKYQELEVLPLNQQNNVFSGRHAVDISVVFHRQCGLGLCDLVYQSATTDRYPKKVRFKHITVTKCIAFIHLLMCDDTRLYVMNYV